MHLKLRVRNLRCFPCAMGICKGRIAVSPLAWRRGSLAFARHLIGYTAHHEFNKFVSSSTSGIYPMHLKLRVRNLRCFPCAMGICKGRIAVSPLAWRRGSLAFARHLIGYTAHHEFNKFVSSSTSGIYRAIGISMEA